MSYQDQLIELLTDISSWKELKDKLTTYNTSQTEETKKISTAGKLFEYFCKYYFLTEPTVKDLYRHVWLFDEVPSEVKEKLNINNTIEYGVDLVLEDTEGKYTAIQCKFRNDEDSMLSWSKDKIANLFGFSSKADYFAVFTNASELDEVSKGRTENFLLYTIANLLEITPETFEVMKKLLQGEKIIVEKASPRDYQIIAINAVVDYLQTHERGQLILPCGTGKTLISLWIKERIRPKVTLVLLPSLALLRQTKNEWAQHKRQDYKYLCVCSEGDIDKNSDTPEIHTYELQSRVTTDSEEIQQFITSDGEKIIFSTYQSLREIEKAIQSIDFSFDLVFCDEAHKTTGSRNGKGFTLIHDNTKIPAQKRLYMTATPKVLSASLKAQLDEDVELLADMSNPEIYGEEAYRMTFKDAIEKGILVDYRIVAVGVTDKELQQYLAERRYVSTKETIDEIANNYALNLVMERYQANHALTFHSRVNLAKDFSERHKEIVENVYATYVSGAQTTSSRSKTIERFKQESKAVISNARCLTEGVDVPIIDLIYFCDPKYSTIDIVQAAGRAMRKDKHGFKKLGYIVVPIFHGQTVDIEKAIDESVFKNLIQVIRSMCDQDERLQEEINTVAFDKGKRTLSHRDLIFNEEDEEKIITLVGFEEKLKQVLFNQVIEKTKDNWNLQYLYLLDFRKQYPGRWPEQNDKYPADTDNSLGQWTNSQRVNYNVGKLSLERINKLININFDWNPIDTKWNQNYQYLLDYRNKNPHSWPATYEQYPQDNNLGLWCATQKSSLKERRLSKIRFDLLNNIGFVWDLWEEQFNHLLDYRRENPNKWPKRIEEYPKGNKLGVWCFIQRLSYYNKRLENYRIEKLNNINFPWSVLDSKWQNQFEILKSFRKKYINRWPKTNEQFPHKNNLGEWCAEQREKYALQRLSQERIDKLNSIKFLWDTSKDVWTEHFNALIDYRRQNPSVWPTGDNELSRWCGRQRWAYKRNKLTTFRAEKLISINFLWELNKDDWEINYNHLKKYMSKFHGKMPSYDEQYPNNNNLGAWCARQKRAYKNGVLSLERIQKLKKIGFTFDIKFQVSSWEEQYKKLKDFRSKFPDKWPERNKNKIDEYNNLSRWCTNQRMKFEKGDLDTEKIKLLNKIGFIWKTLDQKWLEQYNNLQSYRGKNPTKWPINTTQYPLGNNLGRWFIRQLLGYKSQLLSNERVKLLKKIGVNFEENSER